MRSQRQTNVKKFPIVRGPETFLTQFLRLEIDVSIIF